MQTPRIDPQAIAAFLSAKWDQDIVPQLVEYIRIYRAYTEEVIV